MAVDSRVKIAFFVGTFRYGGNELYIVRLLKGISKKKFVPHVLCFQKKGDLLPEVLALNCPIAAFPLERRAVNYVKNVIRIAAYLKRENIQVLYTLGDWADWFGVLGGKLAGVPAVISTMRNMGHMLSNRRFRFATQFVYKYLADGVIVNAKAIRQMMIDKFRVTERKIVLLHNVIPLNEKNVIPYDHPALSGKVVGGFMGTLKHIKGFDLLIEAAACIGEDCPDLIFLVVGDGPEAHRYMQNVCRRGLETRFHFVGYQREIFRFMKAMDFLILPSRIEGFPTVIWEALACGRPVIAARVGGVPEVIQEGQTGFLIDPERTDLLLQSIKAMYQDPRLCQMMGRQGQKKIEDALGMDGGISDHETYFLDQLRGSR